MIEKDIIQSRIKNIELHIDRLREMSEMPVNDFLDSDNFAIASYNLRSALEATFDIAGHILARIPGVKVREYKEMAKELGKQKIVSQEFSKRLERMGGYRNRLTHFYFEVKPKEMYEIVQNNLGDFETFMRSIKEFLQKENILD